eukprot:13985464-Alexandrium_andersonii.AAC.1
MRSLAHAYATPVRAVLGKEFDPVGQNVTSEQVLKDASLPSVRQRTVADRIKFAVRMVRVSSPVWARL